MHMCSNQNCPMPAWADGVDEELCLGHQPALDPTVEEPLGTACIECGLGAPAGLAFFDRNMPGEPLCLPCAEKLQAHMRLDEEGYNY
jgi:hypothetical protein